MNQSLLPRVLAVPVTEQDHLQGNANAPLTLLEYGDYECPHCAFALPIVKELQQRLGTRLRIGFRHFPQNNVHPHASMAAMAAEAASAQGRFWDMHDLLYQHQRELDLDYTRFALRLGLEMYRFESDLSSEIAARRIRLDYRGGLASGVHGTPTFFINQLRYEGPLELVPMNAALEAAAASPAHPASAAPGAPQSPPRE